MTPSMLYLITIPHFQAEIFTCHFSRHIYCLSFLSTNIHVHSGKPSTYKVFLLISGHTRTPYWPWTAVQCSHIASFLIVFSVTVHRYAIPFLFILWRRCFVQSIHMVHQTSLAKSRYPSLHNRAMSATLSWPTIAILRLSFLQPRCFVSPPA